MKVLMLHNRYKISGGEDVSAQAEADLLKNNNIEVETFYVNNFEIDGKNKMTVAKNTIWSGKYYREILEKIHENKYDIVHVQNFFPLLSPSIFYACYKTNTKVLMSVRNYRLVCPNALMYVNGNICRVCVGKKFPAPAILKKCYRKSYLATTAIVSMLTVHNFLNTWRKKIDGLICISEFVKGQPVSGGFNENKLFVKHNFVSTTIEPNF